MVTDTVSQELTFMESTDEAIYKRKKVCQTGASCCNLGSDRRF